jgi:hypothetical protein
MYYPPYMVWRRRLEGPRSMSQNKRSKLADLEHLASDSRPDCSSHRRTFRRYCVLCVEGYGMRSRPAGCVRLIVPRLRFSLSCSWVTVTGSWVTVTVLALKTLREARNVRALKALL